MSATTALPMVDGVKVVVPDSLELITSYVLREQHDWFEDELRFLRRWLSPGQRVIDVGANHGVYALSMARAVGPTGRVWAFEPATTTAALLAESIALNGFGHLVLERLALSNVPGRARLSLCANSELNALSPAGPGPSEEVAVSTLDECQARLGWRDVAFLKIDAEGEEARILEGGARFLAEESPLVQFEIKAGATWNLGLAEAFTRLGYAVYRLAPGPGVLLPFDTTREPDGFLLNLYAARPDRAAQLASRGVLVERVDAAAPPEGRYGWASALAGFPYAAALFPSWAQAGAVDPSVEQALAWFCCSRDPQAPAGVRVAALSASLELLRGLAERAPTHLRLASLSRVAEAFGARILAATAAQQLCAAILHAQRVDATEPFLAPAERFERLAPGNGLGDWVLAGALEQTERLAAFSSFYTGDKARSRLETISRLGFASDEMLRRLDLVRRRYPARA